MSFTCSVCKRTWEDMEPEGCLVCMECREKKLANLRLWEAETSLETRILIMDDLRRLYGHDGKVVAGED